MSKPVMWSGNIPLFKGNSEEEVKFMFRPAVTTVFGKQAKFHTLKTYVINNEVYVGWSSFRDVEDYAKRQKGDRFKPMGTVDVTYAFGWAYPKREPNSIQAGPWMTLTAVMLRRKPGISEGRRGDWHTLIGTDVEGYTVSDYVMESPLRNMKPKWEALLDSEEARLGDIKRFLPLPGVNLVKQFYNLTKIPEGLLVDLS